MFIKNQLFVSNVYNLKGYGGTYKGHVGEFMFKMTRK